MSSSLIIITGLIYTYVGIDQFLKGNSPMGVTYLCYAGANYGLWMNIK
jgi:hypothetical protein